MIKTLILDFDGTLADTRSLIVGTLTQAISHQGLIPPPLDECAATIGLPLDKTFSILTKGNRKLIESCIQSYEHFFAINNKPEAVKPFKGVISTLKRLHDEGMLLTIASSRGSESLRIMLKNMGLVRCISTIISANDVTHCKPHPEAVLRILSATGHQAQETLVVGDTSFDILMGRSAQVHTCGVTYGNGSRESMIEAGAEYMLDDFGQLHEIIKNINEDFREMR